MAPVKKKHHPLQRTYLREWRDYLGLTQDQVAEKIDLGRDTLSKIETGKSPYTQRTLEAAARAFGVHPAAILLSNPQDPSDPWRLLTMVATAPPLEREQILEYAAFRLKIPWPPQRT
ncbi:helix-turn-helix domain-containing protein [Pseudochelatococcus sp. B33]